MKEENLEKLISYVSEHNENYYSFSRISRKFNVNKRVLKVMLIIIRILLKLLIMDF